MRSFDGKLRMCESLKASFCSSSECPQVQSLQISILIHRFAESDFSQDIFIGICRSNILQDIKPPSNGGTMCTRSTAIHICVTLLDCPYTALALLFFLKGGL